MNLHDKASEAEAIWEAACTREYERLTRRLRAHVEMLERMGENDMGNLSYRQAHTFHTATAMLRTLLDQMGRATP